MQLLQKQVKDEKNKKIFNLFRKLKTYRNLLNGFHLSQFWGTFWPEKCDIKFDQFEDYVVSEKEKFELTPEEVSSLSDVLEVELYCRGLTLMYLVK